VAADHELLADAAAAGQSPAEVAPYRFGPPLSPHYAAELAGETIEPALLVAAVRRAARVADVVVCEGVGGLLVPITPGYLVRDLAVASACRWWWRPGPGSARSTTRCSPWSRPGRPGWPSPDWS
jgi:dethiobiotin synthetase